MSTPVDVYNCQLVLRNQGYSISIDGQCGPGTKRCLMDFQSKCKLTADGLLGPATNSALQTAPVNGKYLSLSAVKGAASTLGVSPAHILTVLTVETSGLGFLSTGSPTLLFERHVFYRELKKVGVDADKVMATNSDICNTKPGGYTGGAGELPRLAKAKAINSSAALSSASWGLFQIMGNNYASCGYKSVEELVDSFTASEVNQLNGFVHFLQSNPSLLAALKANNWAGFAKGYNGPAFATNKYDVKLAAAYATHSQFA